MGFDLFGTNAVSEKGEYFRNNVWWWRPLADYVVDRCNLDGEGWFDNRGHEVSATTAQQIAKTLDELAARGAVRDYQKEYMAQLDALPDQQCSLCNGSGVRSDEFVKGACNACKGAGHVPAWPRHYPFSEENVRAFADFCRDSGGFAIC